MSIRAVAKAEAVEGAFHCCRGRTASLFRMALWVLLSAPQLTLGAVIVNAIEHSYWGLLVGGHPNWAGDYITFGSITVDGGSQFYAPGFGVFFGNFRPGSGIGVVSGEGSRFGASSIWVGQRANGTLRVSGGGIVETPSMTIGTFWDPYEPPTSLPFGSWPERGTGIVEVTGGGSKVDVSGFFHVGNYGHGTLRILEGGRVVAQDIHIGSKSTSIANATVSGQTTSLVAMVSMSVGFAGQGNLEVSAHAHVDVPDFSVGVESGGSGTFSLVDGATATGTVAVFGVQEGARGEALLRGAGTRMTNSDSVFLGFRGTAFMDVVEGAHLVADQLILGWDSGSAGNLVLTSSLTSEPSIAQGLRGVTVGLRGKGSAVVDTGAWLRAGGDAGNFGELIVGGQELGEGMLEVKAGGNVVASQTWFGHSTGSIGSGSVRGPGAGMHSILDLVVGGGGQGKLTVGGGAVVATDNFLTVAGGNLGELTVEDGGTARAPRHIVGFGSEGTAHVKSGGAIEVVNDDLSYLSVGVPQSVNSQGRGMLIVDSGGVIRAHGIANLFTVARGEAQLNGKLELTLKPGSTLLAGLGLGLFPDGRLILRGETSISADAGTGRLPGEFVPLLNAGRIDVGTGPVTVVESSGGQRKIHLGQATLTAPLVNDSAGRQSYWAPERLRVECSQGCNEVLGLRVTAVAATGGTTAELLPKFAGTQAAEIFLSEHEVRSASALAASIYNEGLLVGAELRSMVAGQPITFNVLSSMEIDGLRALAVQRKDNPGEISIVIRGTENSVALVDNWASNFGFAGPPTQTLRQYVHNLSSFAGSVYATNPESQIRFVGHSLGGGLAQLVGWEMGVDAYAFNAPPIGNVFGEFQSEAESIRAVHSTSGQTGLVNFRLAGDPVSALPLPAIGQVVTIQPDPLIYLLQQSTMSPRLLPIASQLVQVGAAGYLGVKIHGMDSVLDRLALGAPVMSVRYGNEEYVNADATPTLEDALGQILAPVKVGSPRPHERTYEAPVRRGEFKVTEPAPPEIGLPLLRKSVMDDNLRVGLLEAVDSIVVDGYLFAADSAGPAVAGVLVPLLDTSDTEYFIEILSGEQWQSFGTISAQAFADFGDAGVRTFRVRGMRDSGIAPNVGDVFFGLTFVADGTLRLTVTELDQFGNALPVPEPSVGGMLVVGVLLLTFARLRQHGRASRNVDGDNVPCRSRGIFH